MQSIISNMFIIMKIASKKLNLLSATNFNCRAVHRRMQNLISSLAFGCGPKRTSYYTGVAGSDKIIIKNN